MLRGSVEDLVRLVASGGVVVLSGAGISTASGIPDYRGPTGQRRTAPPMQWADFASDEQARRRYWARGQVGFRRYAGISPNPAHHAVAALEARGLVDAVVTQNVDGLHQAAGSQHVVELHGSLREVSCLGCGAREARTSLMVRLDAANPWIAEVDAAPQADGDAVLDDEHVARFDPVGCLECGQGLRPDVVFFGEHVPRPRMAAARDLVEAARCVLVLGSSLAVGSGWLLVRHGLRHGASVGIVNQGATRGDALAAVRVDGDLTALMPLVASTLGASSPDK